jgi:thymidylate synthase
MIPITYKSSDHFFRHAYSHIMNYGDKIQNTMAVHGACFSIEAPMDNYITARKWSIDYAQAEWLWYLSENPSVKEISKLAKIWADIADEEGNVNSNYGYQWSRTRQLNRVISELIENRESRRASISIYDGKESHLHSKDTPCTYALGFNIVNNKLHMFISMRSCDLVYGFCNDQYCFSMLQQLIANTLQLEVGTSTWSIQSLHVYEKHWNLKII